jgi:2-aminoadipate transaminase
MKVNAIREILKVVSKPGMISLAGGLPSPDSFPMHLMAELTATVLEEYGPRALQYDATEGFAPLLAALSSHLETKQVTASPKDLLVFSGSQGVLDAMGKVLISKGDAVAVEAPTYLGAISAFNPYEPRYVTVAADDDGMIPEALDEVLANNQIKFVYLVSTFQNPTGRSLPRERRQQIAEIIVRHNALLIEDDPYGDLRYRGVASPPIKHFAPDNVVYVSTLSKTFAPGLRVGFCAAPKLIRDWLVVVKQGVDLHTSTFNQALAAEYLEGGHMVQHLPHIIELYRPKQTAMLEALDRHFPKDHRWTRPEGGMFLWIEGPQGIDMEKVYWLAIERNVAFVPGKFFFTDPTVGHATMRLNFTNTDEKTIEGAVETLADVLSEFRSR